MRLAEKLDGEIISCDSMQVYKGMPILSQAPSGEALKKARHHLIGFVPPEREFNVSIFREEASRKIRDVLGRKKTPLVVGGSGLYVKALIDGLFPSPERDASFRARMQRYVARNGSPALHIRLTKIDPETASRIHPNDSRRVIRALEIYNSTKKTMSELKTMTRGLKDEFDIVIFGLTLPREELYKRINTRVDEMIGAGLFGEVRRLMKVSLSRTARQALGFNEISGYLKGELTLDEAVELLKKNTRNFAKRQIAWFRADKRIVWLDIMNKKGDEVADRIWKRLS